MLKYKRMEREFRFGVRKVIKTQVWYWTVIMLVFLNAICAALEHYNQPEWLTKFLSKIQVNLIYKFNQLDFHFMISVY